MGLCNCKERDSIKLLGEDKNISEYLIHISDKQVISSTIVTYTNVNFERGIPFTNKRIPSTLFIIN